MLEQASREGGHREGGNRDQADKQTTQNEIRRMHTESAMPKNNENKEQPNSQHRTERCNQAMAGQQGRLPARQNQNHTDKEVCWHKQ